jgi:hypothetical protein
MDYYGNDPLILKLGHIQGCLAFSAKKLAKKMFPRPKLFYENTMGNPFFETPFFGTKRSKKI